MRLAVEVVSPFLQQAVDLSDKFEEFPPGSFSTAA